MGRNGRPPFRPDPVRNRLVLALDLARGCREDARRLIAALPTLWAESTARGAVPSNAWIAVRRVASDLDSALDYIASDLEARGVGSGSSKAYFPIARIGQPEVEFAEWFRRTYVGVEEKAPGAAAYIIELQHFGRSDQGWLFQLRALAGVLKHRGPPHHHLRVARWTVTKEGYRPQEGADFMIEFEGFDGDLVEFLLRASGAIIDVLTCMLALPNGWATGQPRRSLEECLVNGDHHTTIAMEKLEGGTT